MSVLQEFKQFEVNDESVENMLVQFAFGKSLQAAYAEFGLESPECLSDRVNALGREIKIKQRDELERELKKAELALEGLKSAEEKRSDLRAKAERLRAKLGS